MNKFDISEKFGGVNSAEAIRERGRHEGEVKAVFDKVSGLLSRKAWVAVLWLLVGQFIQVAANLLAVNVYARNPVAFCVAAGFLVTVSIVLGMVVGRE